MIYHKTNRKFITFHQRLLGFDRAARTRAFLKSMGYVQYKGPWTIPLGECLVQPMTLPVGLIFCPKPSYRIESK